MIDARDYLVGARPRLAPLKIQPTSESHLAPGPSGFGTICPVGQGDVFHFDPFVTQLGIRRMDDDHATAYLEAVITWWLYSAVRITAGMEPAEIVTTFVVNEPAAAGQFLTHPYIVAGHFTLVEWLAPTP